MKTLKEKAEAVLACMYGGLHNVPGKIKELDHRIEVSVPVQISTYDFDGLTRLVVMAHDKCVRACLRSGGPRRVVIMFHDRTSRDGSMTERHPTMEEAIANIRKPLR